MPVPKSVMKLSKNGVEFTSSVDRVNYTITELTRRAMMDVGRFVLYQVSAKVRGINKFTKKARYAPKRYQMWVPKRENYLVLGIENTKKGAKTAWWADQSELGTDGQPRRGFLTETVRDNIDKIREIEAQYLSAIEDENNALALIDEDNEAQEEAEG